MSHDHVTYWRLVWGWHLAWSRISLIFVLHFEMQWDARLLSDFNWNSIAVNLQLCLTRVECVRCGIFVWRWFLGVKHWWFLLCRGSCPLRHEIASFSSCCGNPWKRASFALLRDRLQLVRFQVKHLRGRGLSMVHAITASVVRWLFIADKRHATEGLGPYLYGSWGKVQSTSMPTSGSRDEITLWDHLARILRCSKSIRTLPSVGSDPFILNSLSPPGRLSVDVSREGALCSTQLCLPVKALSLVRTSCSFTANLRLRFLEVASVYLILQASDQGKWLQVRILELKLFQKGSGAIDTSQRQLLFLKLRHRIRCCRIRGSRLPDLNCWRWVCSCVVDEIRVRWLSFNPEFILAHRQVLVQSVTN